MNTVSTLKIISAILIICSLCGCSKLSRLPQLLTLKSAGDNRDLQKKHITRERESFQKVLAAYKDNTLPNYPDKRSVLKVFGAPLLVRDTVRGEQPVERWLYRDPLKSFESEKVYLYFDQTGKLTEWEYVQPKPKSPPAADAAPSS